jgi:hypothetical protein
LLQQRRSRRDDADTGAVVQGADAEIPAVEWR